MKKYLLFLFAMLYGYVGAWADLPTGLTVTDNNPTVTIGSDNVGLISSNSTEISNQSVYPSYRSRLKITGSINQDDIDALKNIWTNFGNDNGTTPVIDFSEAVLASGTTISVSAVWKGVIVPSGYELSEVTGDNVSYVADMGESSISLYITKDNGFTDCKAAMQDKLYLLQYHNITYACASGVDKTSDTFKSGKSAVENAVGDSYTLTEIIPVSNDPYTVSGCEVIINMAKAEENETFAEVLAKAKATMGGESICTLILQGDNYTNADLAVLGDADVAGATRIDMSGATLASGASINNIQLPASLQQLVLPKDLTVSSVLASKLAAVAGLDYAVSPSSST